jgi:phage terminase large subunit-like protein
MYPETGPLRRDLYAKHMQHMAAGAQRNQAGDLFNERALTGGNRSGKTMCCSYEHVCHLVGWYPAWWEGFRFDRPITGWAAGEDTKAVRESLQVTFLGPPGNLGTGLIPFNNIIHATPRGNVPGAVDSVTIRSSHGGVSRLLFKSYDQGRESFQASKIDVMQFDEEPPSDIYTEGLTRTMSTVPGESNGLVICGFTPLRGLSAVVLSYMPGGERVEGAVAGAAV